MIEFIIPTYNRPNQLLTVIGSILSQTNSNWKIHVVADAILHQVFKIYFCRMITPQKCCSGSLPPRFFDPLLTNKQQMKDLTSEKCKFIVYCLLHNLKRDADEAVNMDGQPAMHKNFAILFDICRKNYFLSRNLASSLWY